MKVSLLLILMLANSFIYAQEIPLLYEISNLNNSKGNIVVRVFNDQEGFEKDIPYKEKIISKQENYMNGVVKAKMFLPKGTYGIAVVDDENNNYDMDYNLLGMPKEGFGFSEYFHSGLKRPRFSDFSFRFNENTGVIKIRLKYM